jgi:hypothetical protein
MIRFRDGVHDALPAGEKSEAISFEPFNLASIRVVWIHDFGCLTDIDHLSAGFTDRTFYSPIFNEPRAARCPLVTNKI